MVFGAGYRLATQVARLPRRLPEGIRSPDHAYYLGLRARGLSHTRATLTIARKLARRCFHTLSELGPEALEPVS